MALCYNFRRVLNILGFERFVRTWQKRHVLPANAALLPALRAVSACFADIPG